VIDQIDRMALSARRHVRYEREKAMKWIAQWNLRPRLWPSPWYQGGPMNAAWASTFTYLGLEEYDVPISPYMYGAVEQSVRDLTVTGTGMMKVMALPPERWRKR
jgi:hypothetical protein